jgi:hypothetical protein
VGSRVDPRARRLTPALVQFAVTGGQLGTTWSTLPDYDILDFSVFALSSDGSQLWFDDVEISHREVLRRSGAARRKLVERRELAKRVDRW